MPRIKPVDHTNAPAETQELLAEVKKNLGMVPNMIATMAQSHAVAEAHLSFSQALSRGVIPERLGEQIALAVGQANEGEYCVAAHCAIGSSVGLTEDEVRDARTGTSPDRRIASALHFVRRIVDQRGAVLDDDVAAIRDAGYSDAEIVELVAHVAMNQFTNYFNGVAETEIDFPPVAEVATA